MNVTKQLADEAILRELGTRLARARLDRNLTQVQFAKEAGISKSTVQRLETGGAATQLSAFIRVCRALDLVDRLNLLVPEPVASPIEQLKLRGRTRQRASTKGPVQSPAKKWKWGTEQ